MPDLGGGYKLNPQQAQGAADQVAQAGDPRATAAEAGYLELPGAQKDSDCQIVKVDGGISSQGGCCNLWDMVPNPTNFSCGTCTKIKPVAPTGTATGHQTGNAGAGGGDMTIPPAGGARQEA